MTSTPLDITRALIRCPSVTPKEGGALAYLEKLLGEAGFETHRVTFSDRDTPDVENLYARIGEAAPHLTFAGHTDVVPTGDESLWRFPPFSAEVAEGRVWGRGACDMKGGVAAFAAAALRYVAKHGKPKGTISLLITGDEEGPAINGTVKLLEWAAARGEKFSHAIVGEPTNPNALGDMIKIGRRGSLNGDITVVGRQGHSAYPQQADNPIPALARIVTALSAAPLDDGNAAFDPTRLVVTSVDVGNAARNVIPGEATAKFNVRFNDIWTPDTLGARIREIVAEAAQGADARVKLHPTNSISFRTQRSGFTDMVAAAIEKKTGRTPELSTTGGTSDARFIANYCPVLEFGLVGKTIHATDENVEIADLDRLAEIYEEILQRYFG
ncbi:MAG TPA: succinyl-diaminopimelate desuccinylase [Rhodoblastus sp.]|nr:succinyl-diaminopimelate desuccinylase [Rhodoblastus sp.]